MTLLFGANIDICDTVRYKDVMECGFGPNGGILTSLKGEDFFIGTKAVLLYHVLIPHHIANIMLAPNGRQCHHRMVKVSNKYTFRNKDFFYFYMVS
jgi:hypothetical protein